MLQVTVYRGIGGMFGIGPDKAALVPSKTCKKTFNFE